MKDLQSLVVENIVIWLPALERGQGEFYDAFLMGDGGVEEKYGCVGRKVEAKDWRQRRHRAEVCGSLSCSSISSGSILQMLMCGGCEEAQGSTEEHPGPVHHDHQVGEAPCLAGDC